MGDVGKTSYQEAPSSFPCETLKEKPGTGWTALRGVPESRFTAIMGTPRTRTPSRWQLKLCVIFSCPVSPPPSTVMGTERPCLQPGWRLPEDWSPQVGKGGLEPQKFGGMHNRPCTALGRSWGETLGNKDTEVSALSKAHFSIENCKAYKETGKHGLFRGKNR